MQNKIAKYFENDEGVILSIEDGLDWPQARQSYPCLPKGWFELSRLEGQVRQEFLRDYWINALPYSPQLYAFIDRFFSRVLETAVVSSKRGVFMVYALKGNLMMGGPPLKDEEIKGIVSQIDFSLSEHFLQFFRIHDGFFRAGDTGIFSSSVLVEEGERFRNLNQTLKMGNHTLTTASLLPFYRSFGLDVYQCFYQDWYPDREVGNILCSLTERTVSDYRSKDERERGLAFPGFLEWLMFYMEDIEAE